MRHRKKALGVSFIEILVVVLAFAVVAGLATQSLLLTLRGTKRSESSITVRENLNYALSIMERQLHNADSVTCPDATTISYDDGTPPPDDFTCDPSPPGSGVIASSSAQLTSSEVVVTACNFTCSPGSAGVPVSVSISITAQDADSTGLEQQEVTTNTQIMLRTY